MPPLGCQQGHCHCRTSTLLARVRTVADIVLVWTGSSPTSELEQCMVRGTGSQHAAYWEMRLSAYRPYSQRGPGRPPAGHWHSLGGTVTELGACVVLKCPRECAATLMTLRCHEERALRLNLPLKAARALQVQVQVPSGCSLKGMLVCNLNHHIRAVDICPKLQTDRIF